MVEALFPILQVQPDERLDIEQLGSKPKFWFQRSDGRWLFKEAREHTGEDWAEKIASEIAKVVGIETATVELADFEGKRGCASRSFVDREAGQNLIHGNELLAGAVIGYDRNKKMNQSDHTLDNIYQTIMKIFPHQAVYTKVLQQLASYIVLDAIIGNTDRHHENWGLMLSVKKADDKSVKMLISVAPTFDHASSLGRELRDDRRAQILQNKRIPHYVRAGRGGIYADSKSPHGANPLRLVGFGARQFPQFFELALQRVSQLNEERVKSIIQRVPANRMSDKAREFAFAMLAYSLTELKEFAQ